jgi:hypothetical protein
VQEDTKSGLCSFLVENNIDLVIVGSATTSRLRKTLTVVALSLIHGTNCHSALTQLQLTCRALSMISASACDPLLYHVEASWAMPLHAERAGSSAKLCMCVVVQRTCMAMPLQAHVLTKCKPLPAAGATQPVYTPPAPCAVPDARHPLQEPLHGRQLVY